VARTIVEIANRRISDRINRVAAAASGQRGWWIGGAGSLGGNLVIVTDSTL
jgi:hypothetical protein